MNKMTVGNKISLACAALVVLTIVLGLSSIVSLSRVNTITQTIISDPLPSNYIAGRLNSGAKKIMVWMNVHIQSESKEEMARMETQIAARHKQWQEDLHEYQKLITNAEDRAMAEKIGSSYDRIARAWEKVLPLSRALKNKEAFALFHDEALPAMEDLDRAANQLVLFNKTNGEKLGQEASQAASFGRLLAWGSLALSVLCGSALAFLIVRGVNRSLRRIVTELSEGAEQVASAASQVSSSSQSLAQGSSEQAASLEETSASTEEINSMAHKNSENSRVAADLMTQSQQKVVETNESLELTVAAMGEINAQSGKISKIIKTIDEIAFQTNILALNAAVEAARAGEAGMGFAVVADEVRNLAQRCAQAAQDTASLIEESIAKSNDGKMKVDQVARAIQAITDESARVKTLVDEVNLGSQEQARGIEQIGKAIAQMEQVTQKTAANAEESASAAEELNAQSETLKHVVERLTAMVGGSGTGDAEPAPLSRK